MERGCIYLQISTIHSTFDILRTGRNNYTVITAACINFMPSQNTFYFNQIIITSIKTKAKVVALLNTFFAKKHLNTCINHLILPASCTEDIITPISQKRMLKQRAKYVYKASKWENQECVQVGC